MKKYYFCIVIILSLGIAQPAISSTPTNILGTCLIDALNGKERKKLAKWIFLAMAAHPDISVFSNASKKEVDSTDQYLGNLITRLLVEDCPSELKLANDSDPLAMQNAFELVGQVAMQEIMTNQSVMRAITGYAKYADTEKISSILAGE